MSEKNNGPVQFIRLTAFRKDVDRHQPIIVNTGHIKLLGGKHSIRDTGDLKTTECTAVELFGSSPFLVSEKIDDIQKMLNAEGIHTPGVKA